MLNFPRDSQTYKNEPIEENLEQAPEQAPEQSFEQATEGRQLRPRIPSITIEDPEQNRTVTYDSEESLTETEMSSRSHHHSSSSSKGKSHSSSHAKSSKTKKDDWSEITDPEERRRVQNRIAQRKFRMTPPTKKRE
jgi:hypothetical protein